MSKIIGNLIQLALAGQFDVIVHGCNCQCTMGAGIAKQIKKEFPEAFSADLKTERGNRAKLGSISWATVHRNNLSFVVVNAYTQFDYRGIGVKVDYGAIKKSFQEIKRRFQGKRIGYPMIGAGLAGGSWDVISSIIDDILLGEKHSVVILGDVSV